LAAQAQGASAAASSVLSVEKNLKGVLGKQTKEKAASVSAPAVQTQPAEEPAWKKALREKKLAAQAAQGASAAAFSVLSVENKEGVLGKQTKAKAASISAPAVQTQPAKESEPAWKQALREKKLAAQAAQGASAAAFSVLSVENKPKEGVLGKQTKEKAASVSAPAVQTQPAEEPAWKKALREKKLAAQAAQMRAQQHPQSYR